MTSPTQKLRSLNNLNQKGFFVKIMFTAFAVPFLLAGSALATECPFQIASDNYVEDVLSAIDKAETCNQASELAQACALGSSIDTTIAGQAEQKCDADFQKKLSKTERTTYDRLQKKCLKKYEAMEGSMYRSFHAFCRLRVAELYSTLYTPAE